MSVSQYKNGKRKDQWFYRVVVKFPDGTDERIYDSNRGWRKVDAEREEREGIRMALAEHGKQKVEVVPTLTEFVEGVNSEGGWLLKYTGAAGNRASTIREKEHHWRFHIKPGLGSKRLDQMSTEVMVGFFADLSKAPRRGRNKQDGRKLSLKSRFNVRTTLRRMFVSAVEYGKIIKLPWLPKIKVPEAKWDFFSQEETTTLLAPIPLSDVERRALLLFAVRTGARAGEQLAVEWTDLNWEKGTVTFRRSSTRGISGPTKSGREREVPLSPELMLALKAIKHHRSKLIFCDGDGAMLKLDYLHEVIWGACKGAGLRKIRWHDLRHSFGSQLAAAGVPPRQIQAWMGHSTLKQTERYMHSAPGAKNEMIALLDGTRGTAVAQKPPIFVSTLN